MERESVWSIFVNGDNFESFKKHFLPDFYLNPNIPDVIRKEWETTQKLLEQSYYEYDFADVAILYGVCTLDKALQIRFEELTGSKPNRRQTFAYLIDWFFKRNHFEIFNPGIANQLRMIRNSKAHGTTLHRGAFILINKVQPILNLTNDLYEDVVLRTIRKDWKETEEKHFQRLYHNGGILSFNGKKYVVAKAFPILWNNKALPGTHTLSFLPIFDPLPYKEDRHPMQLHFEFELRDLLVDHVSGTISGIDVITEESVTYTNKMSSVNETKYNTWKNEIDSLEKHILDHIMYSPTEDVYRKAWLKLLKS